MKVSHDSCHYSFKLQLNIFLKCSHKLRILKWHCGYCVCLTQGHWVKSGQRCPSHPANKNGYLTLLGMEKEMQSGALLTTSFFSILPSQGK